MTWRTAGGAEVIWEEGLLAVDKGGVLVLRSISGGIESEREGDREGEAVLRSIGWGIELEREGDREGETEGEALLLRLTSGGIELEGDREGGLFFCTGLFFFGLGVQPRPRGFFDGREVVSVSDSDSFAAASFFFRRSAWRFEVLLFEFVRVSMMAFLPYFSFNSVLVRLLKQ